MTMRYEYPTVDETLALSETLIADAEFLIQS